VGAARVEARNKSRALPRRENSLHVTKEIFVPAKFRAFADNEWMARQRGGEREGGRAH